MTETGPLWSAMNARPRLDASELTGAGVPTDPGVYAWYRDGEPVYVGKAGDLHQRVWKNHMGRGVVMTGSAFRRNVAAHLGIATAAEIKTRTYLTTRGDADAVVAWIRGCEVAWITCASHDDAVNLETRMKAEWMPPLTRI
jgi:hypothetical protein